VYRLLLRVRGLYPLRFLGLKVPLMNIPLPWILWVILQIVEFPLGMTARNG
jgi:hypothetical protein